MELSWTFLCCVLLVPADVRCANILFFIPLGSPSHRIGMEPLAEALSLKGHDVTFLVVEKPLDKNNSKIKYFVSEEATNFYKTYWKSDTSLNQYERRATGNLWHAWFVLPWLGAKTCELLYENQSFQRELIQGKKIDLVIVDSLFNECAYGVANHHGSKLILFVLSPMPPWLIDGVGMPDESSAIPDMRFSFPLEMNFFQRFITAVMPIVWRLCREYYYFPKLEAATNAGLNITSGGRTFKDIEGNADLVFLNTHPAQEYARSLPPHVISIGGLAMSENRKPLPTALRYFIESGPGFVYLNFGSNLDFSILPAELQQAFMNVVSDFSEINFVWKMKKKLENLPSNIFVDKWMPQQEILMHPNIKLFITHAGIGGITEAIYGAVPLICFPIYGDQDYNARLVENKQIGKTLEITTLTAKEFKQTLHEMLGNYNRYHENMLQVRQQFLDRPMKPLEEAMWWTEYVLRQNTTQFRRPQSINQSWWIRRQIDVYLTLMLLVILVLVFSILLPYKLGKAFLSCIMGPKEPATINLKRKNGSEKRKKRN